MYISETDSVHLGLSQVCYVHNVRIWIMYISDTASVHLGLSQVYVTYLHRRKLYINETTGVHFWTNKGMLCTHYTQANYTHQ